MNKLIIKSDKATEKIYQIMDELKRGKDSNTCAFTESTLRVHLWLTTRKNMIENYKSTFNNLLIDFLDVVDISVYMTLTKKNYRLIKFSDIWDKKYKQKYEKELLTISYYYFKEKIMEISKLIQSSTKIILVENPLSFNHTFTMINMEKNRLKLDFTLFKNGKTPIFVDFKMKLVLGDTIDVFVINLLMDPRVPQCIIVENDTEKTQKEFQLSTKDYENYTIGKEMDSLTGKINIVRDIDMAYSSTGSRKDYITRYKFDLNISRQWIINICMANNV